MGLLTNQYVSESYQGLLNLANPNTGLTSTLQTVTDGLGGTSPLQISQTQVNISGTFTINGSPVVATDTGSLMKTGSVAGNVLTFTKGDGSTFNLSVDTGSVPSGTISGSQQIIDLGFLQTSSFNSYTSSNDSKVNSLIASTGSYATTSSLTALSQSIATTDLGQDGRLGSLESATGSLQNQINQKLDTGSFNSYTSSNDARVSSLESKTGSYATTGSNNFVGQQNINGSVNVTGSLNVTGEITALSASITYLKTIYQTSSVLFTSGSNILGDEVGDTQTLWGTVNLPTGPLVVTGSGTISGNLNVQTALTASGLNYPTADNGVESFMQTDGAGNLSLKYVKTLYQNIRNMETSSLVKGTPLFVSGNTGDNANVFIADASNPSRMPVTLVAGDNTLAPSETGKGIILGHIEGVDTTGYSPGTVVYVGVGGGWTSVRPTGSTVQVQELGVVTREGTNGMGIVLAVPPTTLPNTETGYMWVGNGNNYPIQVATSSLSVASAVSSSFATNAISSSHSVNSDTSISSSFAQNALSSSHSVNSDTSISSSFAQTSISSSFATNALSASYAPDTTNTGSFAITGSNQFKGDQTITGSLTVRSGSVYSLSNNTTVAIENFLTNSFVGQANIIKGWGDNFAQGGPSATFANYTGSLSITGSNNIVSLPQIRATAQGGGNAGMQGYISGSDNMIMGNTAGIYLNTGSLLFPKTQNNILGNASSITMNFTTSSLAGGHPIITNNFIQGGNIQLNANSGSFTSVGTNIINGGSIVSTQNFVTNTKVLITQNNVNNTTTLNHISSSINYQSNISTAAVTINNHVSSSNITNNFVSVANNAFLGGSNNTGHAIYVSGSQSSNSQRFITDNLIGGRNNFISSSFVSSSNSNLLSTLIYGQALFVSGNHASTAGGSAFLGRYNDATTLHLAQDIVFAVGTGTSSANRRTGLYIDSGSNVVTSGSFRSIGNATVTGSLNVTGSAIITGSVQGNVNNLTVASNTASLDLNNGNFFVLQLTGSIDTHIVPSNIKAGQTVNIKLNTTGSGTVSFPSGIVKQVSGSSYVPTTDVSTDIITLVSFDNTTLFLANVKNLI